MLCANKIKRNKGFTLVEMLVSVAIFSIVLVVIMGSIITIIDVNRKSQSLTIVTNELNFAMESFTRSIKTGKLVNKETWSGPSIDLMDQDENTIKYEFIQATPSKVGSIKRTIVRADESIPEVISLTSEKIDIENAVFHVFGGNNNKQPRILMLIEGKVIASPTISSEFKIQTSVSPRALDKAFIPSQ